MEKLYLFTVVIGVLALLIQLLLLRFLGESKVKGKSCMVPAVKAESKYNSKAISYQITQEDLKTLFGLTLELRPYMRRDGSGQYDEFIANHDKSIIDAVANKLSPELLSTIKCGSKSLCLPIGHGITAKLSFDRQFNSWHYRQQIHI